MATAYLADAAIALNPFVVIITNEDVIDSVNSTQVRSVKWLITLTDAVNELYNVAEVMAVHNGSTANFTVSNKTGDFLAYRITVDIGGSDIQLKVKNNHTNDLKVDLIRISTLI